MKRILHILAQRPEKTGSGTFLQALIKQGRKHGYEQAVLAGIPASEKGHAYFDAPIVFYPVLFETGELPFPVAGMTDIMPYASTMYRKMTDDMYQLWRKAFTARVTQAVSEFHPDVIISNHLWLLSALTKELFPDIPMITACHGTDLRQMELAPQFRNYVTKYCRQIEHIVALHEPQKRDIIAKYGIKAAKIIIGGVGFNPDLFYRDDAQKDKDRINLVYAGKLNFSKGVPSLIQAYNQLSETSVHLDFAGTGTGEECRFIEEMAKNSRLPLTLNGMMPQKDLADLFRKSHLFVFPSFFEGLPLVLLEALACGLRVVTTNLPGIWEFFGEWFNKEGFIEYVPLPPLRSIDKPVQEALPAFEQQFAEAMEKQLARITAEPVIRDPQFNEAMAAMTWESVFQKIEDLLV